MVWVFGEEIENGRRDTRAEAATPRATLEIHHLSLLPFLFSLHVPLASANFGVLSAGKTQTHIK